MVILFLIKEFLIMGTIAIGGLAMIPFIQNIAYTTGWITQAQIIEMITIAEITPGPLGVNMATYVGFLISGVWGGILTTMALIIPEIIITFFIYRIFNKFKESKNVLIVLRGIRPVSLALTAGGVLTIFQSAFLKLENYTGIKNIIQIFNWKCILMGVIVMISMRKIKIPPIVYFIICAIIGIVFKLS